MKREQKGITLIALIITIIVMLILVGVTINVALNGGLFTKAEDAKNQTNLAKEKEILQTKALGYLNNNGYVDLAEYVSKESPLEGYTLTNNEAYVTASNGTNTFYITKQGGITDIEPQGEEDVWYNVSFKDLSQVDLLGTFSGVNYAVGLEDKNGNVSLIGVTRGDGNLMVQFAPDGSDPFNYYLYAYGNVDSFGAEDGVWKYIKLNEDSAEYLNPPTILNVKVDYTYNMGVSSFTESLLKDIVTITEAE